ncbi:hypothetical protein [Paeniglutamicibacter terrestris]|uniref:Uncharacterized protein n=1 Tax=Paeniglutamicibacter terrestris TaxID=2723403 RepID=A0ABX1G7G1_9MICC|nr:hypothetical protein [Paeniglutamicibacter terrestris]NKG22207.1 hypothetical protein [Paeniglutamicibacter terrestris]
MLFIRVRDPKTRHEFDVPETSKRLASGFYVAIKSDKYPPAIKPRKPKHFVASKGVTPKPSVAAEKKEADIV